jgi:hypothetical protein
MNREGELADQMQYPPPSGTAVAADVGPPAKVVAWEDPDFEVVESAAEVTAYVYVR